MKIEKVALNHKYTSEDEALEYHAEVQKSVVQGEVDGDEKGLFFAISQKNGPRHVSGSISLELLKPTINFLQKLVESYPEEMEEEDGKNQSTTDAEHP